MNSIPLHKEELLSKVRGLDIDLENRGVVTNRNLKCGDIVTIFRGTTYLQEASAVGAELGGFMHRCILRRRRYNTRSPTIWQNPAMISSG